MGFSHAGLLAYVPGWRCVQPALRPRARRALRSAYCGPHDNAAFHAAALHGNLHLLRKI